METRTFILPTDDDDNEIAALITVTEDSLRALARMRTAIHAEPEEVTGKIYDALPGASFKNIVLKAEDASLDADEFEMFDDVYRCGSTYMLGKPLREGICGVWDTPLYQVIVKRDTVTFRFDCVSSTVTWNDLGVEPEDLVRCWFNDCPDEHPAARGSELVTCHTCRKEMGL